MVACIDDAQHESEAVAQQAMREVALVAFAQQLCATISLSLRLSVVCLDGSKQRLVMLVVRQASSSFAARLHDCAVRKPS